MMGFQGLSQSMEFVVGVGSGNYFSRFVYNTRFALVPTKCVSDVGFPPSLSPEFWVLRVVSTLRWIRNALCCFVLFSHSYLGSR